MNGLSEDAKEIKENIYINPTKGYLDALRENIAWGVERYIKYVDLHIKECEKKEAAFDGKLSAKLLTRKDVDEVLGMRAFCGFLMDYVEVFYDFNNGNYVLKNIQEIAKRVLEFTRKYTYKPNKEYTKLSNDLLELISRLKYV